MSTDAETNPLSLAVTLLSMGDTTAGTARYLVKRHGSAERALRALNEAHDAMDQLLASLALEIRTQPATD